VGQFLFEGYGQATAGGDGQAVVHVENLNDSGAGSLREAMSAGNRQIVFDVAGDIFLEDHLFGFGANVTINGHTAPAPGITLWNREISLRGDVTHACHDWIIRGLRIRNSTIDGFQLFDGVHDVVIANCSAFNSADGNLDISGNALVPATSSHDITVCWSIFGKGQLVKNSLIAYHVRNVTLHHNLFHGSLSRNPQVKEDDAGGAVPAGELTLDYRNNVVWGWKKGVGTYFQKGARANFVKNYGYATDSGDDYQTLIAEPNDGFPLPADKRTHVYADGNFNLANWDVDASGNDGSPQGTGVPAISEDDDPAELIRYIIAFVGPRFPTRNNPAGLDATDQQLVNEIVSELFRRTA
jgi:hypothetical protein